MEDEEIIELYWHRVEEAIPETSRKYSKYCYTIAYNICGTNEDAEECLNDTWLQTWRAIPDARPSVLSAFLGRISRNIAINRVKERNRLKRGCGEMTHALEELEECIPGGTTPEQAVEEKELEEAIGRFTASLPETDKKMFILRYWKLETVAGIAKKLHCSQGKVKSSLFRTRKKLKKTLQENGLC